MMIRYVMHVMSLMALLCCTAPLSAAQDQPQKKVGFALPIISAEEIRQIRARAIDGHNNAQSKQQKEEVLADAEEKLCKIKEKLELFKDENKPEAEDELQQTEKALVLLKGAVKSVEVRDESRMKKIRFAVDNGHFKFALETAGHINDPELKEEQMRWILMQEKEKKELFKALETPREKKSSGGTKVTRVLSTFNRTLKDTSNISRFISAPHLGSESSSFGDIDNFPSEDRVQTEAPSAYSSQNKRAESALKVPLHTIQPPPGSPRGSHVNRKTIMAGLMGAASMGLFMYLLTGREHNPAAALKSLALIFDPNNQEHQKKAHELLIAIDVYLQKNMAQMPDSMQQLILMLSEYIEFAKNSSLTKELLLEIANQALKVG